LPVTFRARVLPQYPFHRRAAAVATGLVLGVVGLAGCSSDGVAVDCRSDTSCLITFDRAAGASATVLGVEAKLVGVDGSQATVEVAGEQVVLWTQEPETEVAGVSVHLERINDAEVEILVSPA
jgi:hypothetical protein